MTELPEVVITGVGPVSPIGIGRDAFWNALSAGQSGIRPLAIFGAGNDEPLFPLGGEIVDFEGKQHVKPRKSLKVMSREIQLAFASAGLAVAEAELDTSSVDCDRFGVVFGGDMMFGEVHEMLDVCVNCLEEGKFTHNKWGERAMSDMYPLWMLKYLPNMAACHIGISLDARGPNNSILSDEASSLSAIIEAAVIIQRGQADVMIAGGYGTLINLTRMLYRGRGDISPSFTSVDACKPFDLHRNGMLLGEGAGALVLESRQHAEARGANMMARLRGWHNCFVGHPDGTCDIAQAVKNSLTCSLEKSGVEPQQLAHVNAHGLGDVKLDAAEAQGIQQAVGDQPVVGLKGYFGNLGSGTGAIEIIASLISLQKGTIPGTLNFNTPDPACPVNVVAEPTPSDGAVAVKLNQTRFGNAVAMVVERL